MAWIACGECRQSAPRLKREALANLVRTGTVGNCNRSGCPGALRILGQHRYANGSKQPVPFEIIAAVSDGPDEVKFEVFLEALRFENGEVEIIAEFWAPDQNGEIRYGQFSPMLPLTKWKNLFERLERCLEAATSGTRSFDSDPK